MLISNKLLWLPAQRCCRLILLHTWRGVTNLVHDSSITHGTLFHPFDQISSCFLLPILPLSLWYLYGRHNQPQYPQIWYPVPAQHDRPQNPPPEPPSWHTSPHCFSPFRPILFLFLAQQFPTIVVQLLCSSGPAPVATSIFPLRHKTWKEPSPRKTKRAVCDPVSWSTGPNRTRLTSSNAEWIICTLWVVLWLELTHSGVVCANKRHAKMVRVRSYGEGGLLLHVVVLLIFDLKSCSFRLKTIPLHYMLSMTSLQFSKTTLEDRYTTFAPSSRFTKILQNPKTGALPVFLVVLNSQNGVKN